MKRNTLSLILIIVLAAAAVVLAMTTFGVISIAGIGADARGQEEPVPPEPKPEEGPVRTEQIDPFETPAVEEAVVTFLTGEVYVKRDGELMPVEIGLLLTEGDSLRVVDNSFCEIQFGGRALVRVRENTVVALNDIFTAAGEASIRSELVSGEVLVRVNKLIGEDDFLMSSDTTALGVRGTAFYVRRTPEEFFVAVEEGQVSLAAAKSAGETQDGAPRQSSDSILIDAGRELRLDTRAIEAITSEAPDAEAAARVLAQTAKPVELSPDSRGVLQDLEEVRLLEDIEEAQKLVRLEFISRPADARIRINGRPKGSGRVSGLYPVGEEIELAINKTGYKPYRETIVPQAGADAVYTVSLQPKDLSPAMEAEPVPADELEKVRRNIEEELSSEYEQRLERLESERSELVQDRARLRQELEAVEQQLVRTEEESEQLEAEKQQLSEDLAAARERIEKISELLEE